MAMVKLNVKVTKSWSHFTYFHFAYTYFTYTLILYKSHVAFSFKMDKEQDRLCCFYIL